MKYDIILIRYGELTTKGKNRNKFISKLYNNIKNKLKDFTTLKYEKTRDRMYIILNEEDHKSVAEKLRQVFGIYSFSFVKKVDTDLDEIKDVALKIMKEKNIKTFKVETKRSWKEYELQSGDISREVGAHILVNTDNLTVDVHNPDMILRVELRKGNSYVFDEIIKSIGGYPVGIQGKGLLMLSGGIDSPVAGYLALKRGVVVEAIHFASPPHTSEMAKQKVIKLAQKLSSYAPKIKVHVVPFTALQEELYKHVRPSLTMTVMRRMMYRIAEGYSKRNDLKILINGESIGQVASQTLDSMVTINEVTNMPVIRPVATMDKTEIIKIAKDIDTFEISIEPFEDCCTIFVPKNPAISPKLEKVIIEENKFEWTHLVEECITNVETLVIKEDYKDDLDDYL